jgi:transcriptional regulator with XRE-family HTH domain
VPGHEADRLRDMRRALRGFDPERLRIARTSARLSKPELARLSKVGVTTYNQWESGRSSPRVDALARCAEQLHLKITDLVSIDLDTAFLGDLRVSRGLLQSELALRMEVSTQLVGLLERGQGTLTPAIAEKWSRALDYPLEQVVAAYERVRDRPPHTNP